MARAKNIHAAIDDEWLERWGVTLQSWLWAPPAKHTARQIVKLLERIGTPYELGI